MFDLLTRLTAIILLRLGPQDVPPGRPVLITCMALYALVTGISLHTGQRPDNPLGILAVAMIMPLLLCWIVLKLKGRLARWEQTLSALFGTSAVISLMTLPFSVAANSEMPAPVALFLLLAFFWSFAVDAHIWRNTLEVAFSTGLALAVILFAATLFAINILAGPL
jgi:hypothetical protein